MSGIFYHNSHDIFYRSPFGAVCCGQTIRIRFKVEDGLTEIRSVKLRLWRYESAEEKIEMEGSKGCGAQRIYTADIRSVDSPGLIWYYFIIELGERIYYYGNNRERLGGVGDTYEFQPDSFQITVYERGFKTPDWFKNSIMYQIMVDRFRRKGDISETARLRRDIVIHRRWDEEPNYKPDPKTNEMLCNDFFGGNLQGIIEELPYIKSLGVGVIYLNPIFEAYSNHKYDTGDYMKVDPMFGGEEDLKELTAAAESAGIRIIVDGVFSHTGSDSVYFNREGRYESVGAYNSPSSHYYGWYSFKSYPDDYACWWGIRTLPEVTELEPSYMNFILGEKGVVCKWMDDGIKGYRLDVADELPDQFIEKLRSSVKEKDSDGVLIGEVWEDASNKISYGRRRRYMFGNELDSVMNYVLKDCLIDFLTGRCGGEHLHRVVMSLYENYPLEAFYSLMNILGTHDTERILFSLGECKVISGTGRDGDANASLSPEQSALAVSRLKIAYAFLSSFPGVPCIYYGDEAGLGGMGDPFNRRTYPWGHENHELVDLYRLIGNLRNSTDALRTGGFFPVHYGQDTYGFVRVIQNGTDLFGRKRDDGFVLFLMNRNSTKPKSVIVDLRRWCVTRLSDILGSGRSLQSDDGCFIVKMGPLSCVIYRDGSLRDN